MVMPQALETLVLHALPHVGSVQLTHMFVTLLQVWPFGQPGQVVVLLHPFVITPH
jgi:hypothetical protein